MGIQKSKSWGKQRTGRCWYDHSGINIITTESDLYVVQALTHSNHHREVHLLLLHWAAAFSKSYYILHKKSALLDIRGFVASFIVSSKCCWHFYSLSWAAAYQYGSGALYRMQISKGEINTGKLEIPDDTLALIFAAGRCLPIMSFEL